MSIPQDILRENKSLNEWSILLAYRGSIAHGMYLDNRDPNSIDDKDVIGVCVPPIEYYFGLQQFHSHGTQEIKRDEWDIVIYEAKKFISLLAQGNPNVLALLWLEPNYYLKITNAGKLLITHRNIFVGKHVYHAFKGYAHGQLHRMTHHEFNGHMGQKRKQLVEKYGFDLKNAAHLIRLLRMCVEFLTDGELQVLRKDASQLLEIKKGEWSLEQVIVEANRLFALAEQAYVNSKLPVKPNMEHVDALCMSVISVAMRELYENNNNQNI